MKITRDKKRWNLVFCLFLLTSIFVVSKSSLWRQTESLGREIVYTENTSAIVATNTDVIYQSFIAEADYLDSIEMLIVAWNESDVEKPKGLLLDSSGKKIIKADVYLNEKTGMMQMDVAKRVHRGEEYTLQLSFEGVQDNYSVYLVPISDLVESDRQYTNCYINNEETNVILFQWFNYSSLAIDLLLLFLIPIVVIGLVFLLETTNGLSMFFLNVIRIICCGVLCINAVNRMTGANPTNMCRNAWIVTIVWIILLVGIVGILANSLRWGGVISFGICVIYGIIAHYVLKFRGTPFLPIDILALKTAKEVAANYTYAVTETLLLTFISFVVIVVSFWNMKGVITLAGIKKWLVLTSFFIGCIAMCTPNFAEKFGLLPNYYMQEEGNSRYGAIYNFLTNIQSCFKVVPEGYSKENVDILADAYSADELQSTSLPNLIVIMNESWADISNSVGVYDDIMPNIHEIGKEDNAFSGKTVVSTWGGCTNLSEFQFLTGSVIDFGLTGSCYELDCTEGVNSIVSVLKNMGYYTVALHPAFSENWDRHIGYEKLGFDEYISLEDLSDYQFEYTRSYDYVSDSSLYKVIYDLTDKNIHSKKPIFIFCITIQNHGDYNDDSYIATVDSDDLQYAQYLSLVKETDRAYGELIQHYSNEEQETAILMFGDHLPGLDNLNSVIKPGTIERYTTPYIIWSNGELKNEVEVSLVGVNYLQTVLFEAVGLPLTRYQKFLKDVVQEYPVITKGKYYDTNMNASLLEGTIPEIIKNYQILQYNNLLDEDDRNELLFAY